MNHSERSVLLEGRRNRGDRSDELQFGTIFLATPQVILNCVTVCETRRERAQVHVYCTVHVCVWVRYFACVCMFLFNICVWFFCLLMSRDKVGGNIFMLFTVCVCKLQHKWTFEAECLSFEDMYHEIHLTIVFQLRISLRVELQKSMCMLQSCRTWRL